MKRNTAGTGFGAHVVRNCVQNICDTLPTHAEAMVLEIYAYFHICIVSATELQNFYDEVATEYKTILQHEYICFLTYYPGTGRHVEIYGPLEAHSISQPKFQRLFIIYSKTKVASSGCLFCR
jgi:hypothetical protein